jgi:hypothetical protein
MKIPFQVALPLNRDAGTFLFFFFFVLFFWSPLFTFKLPLLPTFEGNILFNAYHAYTKMNKKETSFHGLLAQCSK